MSKRSQSVILTEDNREKKSNTSSISKTKTHETHQLAEQFSNIWKVWKLEMLVADKVDWKQYPTDADWTPCGKPWGMSKILHKNSNACDDALALFVGLRCWLAAAAGKMGWIFLNNGHRHIPIGASFGINIRHAACAPASFIPCDADCGLLTCRRCIFPGLLLVKPSAVTFDPHFMRTMFKAYQSDRPVIDVRVAASVAG